MYLLCNDFRQYNCLKIYRTDLCQIFRVGITLGVDDQSDISFRSLRQRCHSNQMLLVLVHACRWTQAASGAAGRANVWLGPASRFTIALQIDR